MEPEAILEVSLPCGSQTLGGISAHLWISFKTTLACPPRLRYVLDGVRGKICLQHCPQLRTTGKTQDFDIVHRKHEEPAQDHSGTSNPGLLTPNTNPSLTLESQVEL